MHVRAPEGQWLRRLGRRRGVGGGLDGGVPPPELEKNEIRKTLDVIW